MRFLLILFSFCLLSACGFHLRGQGESRAYPFASLHVQGNVSLAEVLTRQFALRQDVRLLPANEAEASLIILSEEVSKQVLSVTGSGGVAEYELIYTARFSLRQSGLDWIAPTALSLRRDYSFDRNNVLGKDAEEQLLIRNMREDAAQQIQRRLAAQQPLPAPASRLP